MLSITFTIIIVTVIVSVVAFKNQQVMDNFIFYPPAVTEKKQYYRFIASGFVHANWGHLLLNMVSFFLFSDALVEPAFRGFFGDYGRAAFLLMYIMALIVSEIPSYLKNKSNSQYHSLGASGAVAAVIFAGIIISPLSQMGAFFIPPVIPGFIFGPLYLIFSAYMERRGGDNINHSAHIWGALFGAVFIIITTKLYSNTDVWQEFVESIKYYVKTKLG